MIGTHLKHTPAYEPYRSMTAVGWDNSDGPFFILTFEPFDKHGRSLEGWLAICRLDIHKTYPTKQACRNAITRWLGRVL